MRTRTLVVTLLLATAASPAGAEEKSIALKDGPGKALVEANCGSCHSLDYVVMNSPFLNATVWEAEVGKMIKVYHAPIEDADAKAILEYLIKNYGG